MGTARTVAVALLGAALDVPASLTFALSLLQPGRFFQHHRFQVLVLLQGAIQGVRAFPLIERASDLGIAVGDEPGQGVGVEAIEDLFAGKRAAAFGARSDHAPDDRAEAVA